ncbi:alpha/beta fold hydrolase [Microvirga sesbaniae]|uniref:alpha/beta fold hydrolase n=1 Tax=Microvirga sesbaniae TaxID=681392 RepID=UPI0021C9EB2E|nr:alpha/beta hydrolase [Microvirga sp. HBU67692]
MLCALAAAAPASAAPIKNVVIVHGALADGSGWRKVHDLLKQRGYRVTIVQPPMTSLRDDVDATRRILDLQDGPSLLVGHSYGGMVVTQAGNADSVAGLVYVAAFQPDAGESLIDLAGKTPPATTGIAATSDGFLYLDPRVFAADFAADLPAADAEFMANSQVFPAKAAFEAKIEQPAWKTKKSWALVASDDRAIHPGLMRTMAQRAGSATVEVKASHAVFMSRPDAVADLIGSAAEALSN